MKTAGVCYKCLSNSLILLKTQCHALNSLKDSLQLHAKFIRAYTHRGKV